MLRNIVLRQMLAWVAVKIRRVIGAIEKIVDNLEKNVSFKISRKAVLPKLKFGNN